MCGRRGAGAQFQRLAREWRRLAISGRPLTAGIWTSAGFRRWGPGADQMRDLQIRAAPAAAASSSGFPRGPSEIKISPLLDLDITVWSARTASGGSANADKRRL